MDSIRRAIRQNIEFFREKQGLTQRELSKRAHYSPTYVGKMERGEASISLEAMIRICKVLDVSPEELIQHEEGVHHSIPPPGEELLSSNPVFDFAFQHVDHLVGVTDKEGRTMLINRSFTTHYNKTPEDIFGTVLWDLPFWQFGDNAQDEMEDAICDTPVKRASFLYQLTGAGEEGPGHVILSHLEDEEDQYKYVVFEILWPSERSKGSVLDIDSVALLSQW